MILLEIHNRAVEDILNTRFELVKEESRFDKIAYTLSDFDGVKFTLSNPGNDKKKILVSVFIKCYSELQEHGINEILAKEYGSLLISPEPNQSVTLSIDLEKLPEDHTQLARKCALLKRNCFSAVFHKFFEFQSQADAKSNCKQAVIHYRDDETMYVQALADRVTVIFSTVFKDTDDMLIGKVFMQEFTEVRRRLDRAPQVLYSHRVPPIELQKVDAVVSDSVAYVTFVLFPRHLKPGSVRENTINLIYSLRNYLHYHIKCSKAYIQMRTRAKTVEFLKVLNRARNEIPTNLVVNSAQISNSSNSGGEIKTFSSAGIKLDLQREMGSRMVRTG